MDELSDQQSFDALLRKDLGSFIAKAFRTVSPGDQYLPNWHIDAIVYQLMEVHEGRNLRLAVTQPPRSLKSICTSVAYVAWALGKDPSRRFACVSYSNELAATLARQFRAVVTSDWYRALFPQMRLSKDSETEAVTTKGGGRFAVPVGGSFTGRGADVIIIDDPMKADDAQSESARRTVNEWYGTTLLSRLDDKRTGAIILVMQRLHEDDLAGKILAEGGWRHLDLPARAEEDEEIRIGPNPADVYRRRKGEALHPEREPLETLESLERSMGSLRFSAQYQQRPVPLAGNLVKRDWIKWFKQEPERTPGAQVIQSWDVASTANQNSDWSVCTTWLIAKREYYLLDVWRGQLEYPDIRQKVVALARRHKPNGILIEEVGPGQSLVQEFRNNPVDGVPKPLGRRPEGDKLVRMEAQSLRFQAGQVHLPEEAPWLGTFLHEILAFPFAKNDDQVDSVSQFLNWAEKRSARTGNIALFTEAIPLDTPSNLSYEF